MAGYPLQDVRVTLYDGKYHTVDSKEIAFVTAAKKAFLEAIGKAKPSILEPIMKVVVTVFRRCDGDSDGGFIGEAWQNSRFGYSARRMVSIMAGSAVE
ncbi:MAG: hypothetical protein R3E08_06340 [Thiotrichaceae bacterium]